MSNPYGGGYQPYDPQPGQPGQPEQHGEPPYGTPGPYGGGNPYGATNPYGAGPGLDGLSIASLVCSLTCCLGPVGIGLGVAGLVRTKGGQRSGRWAAIAGVVIGVVATLAMVGFLVFAVVMGSRTVFEEDARVGQCVDVDTVFDDLTKASCDEPHDAEVVWVEEFDDELLREHRRQPVSEFCSSRDLAEVYAEAVADGEHRLRISVDAFDEDDPDDGDWFVCYLERRDGTDLTAPIAD